LSFIELPPNGTLTILSTQPLDFYLLTYYYYYYYYYCYRFVALCLRLPGLVGAKRSIHSLTPILIIDHPLSASFIYYDPQHSPCSIYMLDSFFSTISLQVLFGFPHGLAPSTAYSILYVLIIMSPPSERSWTDPGVCHVQLEELSFIELSPDGSLTILGTQPLDSGEYQCKATNDAGATSDTVRLDVGCTSHPLT